MEKERENLFEDLVTKLKNGDITPKRFISLFYHCNYLIMKNTQRMYKIPNFDWNEHRKTIMKMADEVIKLYKIKESEDEIILSYDYRQDEIYKVYEENYVEGNEEAFIEYKQSTKLNDYMKKLEEKASNKYLDKQEVKSKKIQKKLENEFELDLKKYVNDL